MTMRARLRWGCGTAIVVAVVIAAGYLRWVSRFGGIAGDCHDIRRAAATSPDGQWEAVVVERDCGATTAVSKHVQLRRISREDAANSVVVLRAARDPLIRWVDATHLRIATRADDRFSVRETQYASIAIEYERVRSGQ